MTHPIPVYVTLETPFGKVGLSALTVPQRGQKFCIYDFGGNEDGPVALIGPGFSYGAISFITLAEVLGRHFRVFSFDPRCHGRTHSLGGGLDCNWGEFARDLRAIMDQLRPQFLILHSMYFSALALIAKQFNDPGLIITAIDPILSPDRERAQKIAAYCEKLPSDFPSIAAAREHWTTEPFRKAGYDGFPPELLTLYLEQYTQPLTHDDNVGLLLPPSVEALMYAARPHSDTVIAGVAELTRPFQLLFPLTRRKGEDVATQLRLAEAVVNNAGGMSQLIDIEGGHNVPMVKPRLIAEKILAFQP